MNPSNTRHRIVVTRAEPDATAFAAQVRAAGFEPIVAPMMTIKPVTPAPAVDDAASFAFTSANGVRAVANAFSGDPPRISVFAVGPITADAARNAGFQAVTTADGDVESLAATIAAAKSGGAEIEPVIHVAGGDRAGDLVAALRAKGIAARLDVFYEAVAAPILTEDCVEALQSDPPAAWVTLFSPRTAKIFVNLVRKAGLESRLAKVGAACMSENVARAATPALWRETAVSRTRDATGVLAAIAGGA